MSVGRGARAVIVIASIFVAGAATGAVLMRTFERPRVVHRVRVQVSGSGVYGSLGLDPQQQARVDSILHFYQPRTDSLLQAALPELRRVVDSADASIRRILTPAQRNRLDSLQNATSAAAGGPTKSH